MRALNTDYSHLRTQLGAVPDHCPVASHCLILFPCSRMNPALQEYVAMDPKMVPVRSTRPFVGLARLPQSIAVVQETMRSLQYIGTELS